MKIKFGLKTKMLLFILITSMLIFIGAIGYISYIFKEKSLKNAKILADTNVKEYANSMRTKLNGYMLATRTMASEFEAYYALPEAERRNYFSDILINVLKYNDDFISVWSICEPNTIDNLDSIYINTTGSTFIGNFSPTYYKDNGELKIMSFTSTVLFQGDYFTIPKSTGKETILEPYYYNYTEIEGDSVLETNLIVPINDQNEEFIGVVGIDVTLETFNAIIKEIKPFNEGFAFLISQNGILVAHKEEFLAGKPVDSLPGYKYFPQDFKSNIYDGKPFSFILKDHNKDGKDYVTVAPFYIGKSETPWSIAISVPVKTIMKKANQSFYLAIFIGLVGLLLLTIVIWIIANNIINPILKTTNRLKELSKGEIDTNKLLNFKSGDEIGEMANSVDALIKGLDSTVKFSNQIGQGNLDAKFDLHSDDDVLGSSLIKMRESLKQAKKEEEIGKIEDQKRNWTTQGMSKFGELLRENNDNMEEMAYNIVHNLAKYIDAIQCAFFIVNNDNPSELIFDLIATEAYKRRKYITKSIKSGETLIGRATEEGKTLHLGSLPDEYIEIVTGVSGEKPKNLLIVPLMVNDIVYGALELISFNSFEDYQVEFVEKIGESIASTIGGIKANIQTAELLEKSNKQADELAQQEEEMRQNMEEMQATQEEAAKREAEMKGLINGINAITLVAEYNLDGQVVEINDELLNIYGLSRHQVLGKTHGSFEIESQLNKEEFDKLWGDLQKGKTRKIIHHMIVNNVDVWLNEIYTPIFDQDGEPVKILNLSVDITDTMKMQSEIENLDQEIKALRGSK
ncbi:cache domain-containing protein [Bacteroidota bacterium]